MQDRRDRPGQNAKQNIDRRTWTGGYSVMKKSSFITLILGTVSGVLFALGMCMALIPEWNAFRPGVVFGCLGAVMALVTFIL